MGAVNSERKSPPENAGDAEPSAKRSCHRSDDVAESLAVAVGGSIDTHNILTTPREGDFNERTWWMVDLTPIGSSSSQGASALVKRCMRTHGWDEAKARKVLDAYRQFMILKKELKDWNAEVLSPCYLVDQMWHCHILDVVNYCHDMMLLCGHLVGHNPDGALDYVAKQERDDTTRASLQDHFGSYDKEAWDYSPAAASANANGNAILAKEESAIADMINIRVKLGRGEETLLEEVSKTTRMGDIFVRYAATKEVNPDRLIFTLNGESINKHHTVADLGLDDNDLIDCLFDPERITIIVKDQNGEEVMYKIRRTTQMRTVFNAYAARKRVDVASLRFLLDGRRVSFDETPAILDLEDLDQVDVILQQCGC